MSASSRWAIGLLVAVAIAALILFARGAPERGGPSTSPSAAAGDPVAVIASVAGSFGREVVVGGLR